MNLYHSTISMCESIIIILNNNLYKCFQLKELRWQVPLCFFHWSYPVCLRFRNRCLSCITPSYTSHSLLKILGMCFSIFFKQFRYLLLMSTCIPTSSHINFQLLTFHIRNAIIQVNFMHINILHFSPHSNHLDSLNNLKDSKKNQEKIKHKIKLP